MIVANGELVIVRFCSRLDWIGLDQQQCICIAVIIIIPKSSKISLNEYGSSINRVHAPTTIY